MRIKLIESDLSINYYDICLEEDSIWTCNPGTVSVNFDGQKEDGHPLLLLADREILVSWVQ